MHQQIFFNHFSRKLNIILYMKNDEKKILNQYKKVHKNDIDFIINQILNQNPNIDSNDFNQNKVIIEMESSLYNKVNDCLQNQ